MDARDLACLWYAVSAYEKLKELSHEQIQIIADACSEYSLLDPLWNVPQKKYSVPIIGEGLSGLMVMSYLAVAVDILSGYQITDHDMSGFKWLKEARMLEQRMMCKVTEKETVSATG